MKAVVEFPDIDLAVSKAATAVRSVDWVLTEATKSRQIDRKLHELSSDNDHDVRQALAYIGDLATKARQQINLMQRIEPAFTRSLYEGDFSSFCGLAAHYVYPLLQHTTHAVAAHDVFTSLQAMDCGEGNWIIFPDKKSEENFRPVSRFINAVRSGELEAHLKLINGRIDVQQMIGLAYVRDFAEEELYKGTIQKDPEASVEYPSMCGNAIARIEKLLDRTKSEQVIKRAGATLSLLHRSMSRDSDWHYYVKPGTFLEP